MQPLPSTSEAELSLGAARTEEPSTSSQSRPRAPWPPIEHEVFLEALTLYGRDWRRVSKVLQDAAAGRGDVGAARSLAQVRLLGGEEGRERAGRGENAGEKRERMAKRRISLFFFFFVARLLTLLLDAQCSMRRPSGLVLSLICIESNSAQ